MRLPAGIRRFFRLGMVRPQVSRDLDDELDDGEIVSMSSSGTLEESQPKEELFGAIDGDLAEEDPCEASPEGGRLLDLEEPSGNAKGSKPGDGEKGG